MKEREKERKREREREKRAKAMESLKIESWFSFSSPKSGKSGRQKFWK